MGIPITKYQTVTVGVVKERGDVGKITAGARRGRRTVDIVDGDVGVVDFGVDGDNFQVLVVGSERCVDLREGD